MKLNVSLSVSKLVGPVGHISEGGAIPEFTSLRTALKFVASFAKQYDTDIATQSEKYGKNLSKFNCLSVLTFQY